jgi:hypothetical protein
MTGKATAAMTSLVEKLEHEVQVLQADLDVFNQEKLNNIVQYSGFCADDDPHLVQLVDEHKAEIKQRTRQIDKRQNLIVSSN